jgi:hypothetical protein
MTREEFTQFRQHYGGPPTPQNPPGLWPHAPLTPREQPLWFRRLKSYPLERLLQALDALSMHDRRQAPSVEQVVEALKTLAPSEVPVPEWQQQMARERGMTVAELLASARPAHEAVDVGRCFLAMFNAGLMRSGQEEAYLAACRRAALDYPADRAFWEAHLAQKRQEFQVPLRGRQRPAPDQVDTLTRLGILLQGGRGHADSL